MATNTNDDPGTPHQPPPKPDPNDPPVKKMKDVCPPPKHDPDDDDQGGRK